MSDSISSQGDPINWFSAHQRAILAELSYVDLQLLVRHCRNKPMDAESQHIAELNAEIERLKAENDSLIEQFRAIREICYAKDKLIIDLADALESIPIILHPPHRELVRRAREATR